jgi:hypothetical protein
MKQHLKDKIVLVEKWGTKLSLWKNGGQNCPVEKWGTKLSLGKSRDIFLI